MTALKIAEDVEAGAEVCGLGMFDQGYYDKLGFGTGNYSYWPHYSFSCSKNKRKSKNAEKID